MTTFLIAAAMIVALGLALLLRPLLWRYAPGSTASHRQLNVAIHRDQLAELECDRSDGELSEEDYLQARAELQRRTLEDSAADMTTIAPPHAPKKTLLALALLLPIAAVVLYAALGTPAGIDPPHRFTAGEVDQMISTLAARLEKEPDNLQGWVMLARSQKVLRRFDESVRAFEHAYALVDQDAQLLSEYADALIAQAGGDFSGKPTQLIERALELDPQHPQALWLAGGAAFARGNFDQAVAHWQRLLAQLPPESEDAQALHANIDAAKAQGGKAPAR